MTSHDSRTQPIRVVVSYETMPTPKTIRVVVSYEEPKKGGK